MSRIESSPELKESLVHIKEGDTFPLDDLELMPIETPGHTSDHLCFLLKEIIEVNGSKIDKYSLFSGDHIVGASSTYFEDYPKYYDSLVKTRKLIEDMDIEKMYVAHSMSLLRDDVGVDARQKNQVYLKRRQGRDKFLEATALQLCLNQNGKFSL